MTDPYHHIYTGEIFQQSECIWHENNLLDFFRSSVKSLGYHSVSDSNKVWRRGDQTVVVCLVDDYTTCAERFDLGLPYIFDSNTTVITDTCVQTPTQYRVCQLPASFFGIYAHVPKYSWNPQRRFTLGINRLDSKRMLMFLELALRSEYLGTDLDYVNLNCWRWGGENDNDSGLRQNFETQYRELESQYHAVYDDIYSKVINTVPYKNHTLTQEQVHVSAWLNIVMETYSADNTIALSEKTFRALCMPSPWQLYSGRNTVAYLHSLGFDTLQDIVTHRYDSMIENRTAAYGDKMVDFLFEATENVQSLQGQDRDIVSQRCQQAAERNQQLLAMMRYNWPRDFARWWPSVLEQIQ
jgi:hypothetical protein